MRAWICGWIACVGIACTGVALAAPKVDVRDQLKRATALHEGGEHDKALAVVDEGLALAPADLELLRLKAAVLVELHDYSGAVAAFEAYLGAGPTSGNRRKVLKIIEDLSAVRTTFLDLSVTNGPAEIYLDSRTRGLFCTAAPSCNKALLPREYKVIAERPGFERWTDQVTITTGTTTKLSVTLVEKPSQLTVRVVPAGALVTVDGAAYDAPGTVTAGPHAIGGSLAGHVEHTLEVAAREGKPIELSVVLTPLVAVRTTPPDAALFLDDRPIAAKDGSLAIPPGPHVLIARAPGFRDRRVEIPATRGPDFRLDLELEAGPEPIMSRRNLPRLAAGVAMIAGAGGTMLLVRSNEVGETSGGVLEVGGYAAVGIAAVSAVAAVVLSVTAPRSRVTVAPRVDRASRTAGAWGLDLAVRF
jgi:hypothetical protein